MIRGQDADSSFSDSLQVKGQISSWLHINPGNELPVVCGGRYIPEVNYSVDLPGNHLIDLEVSANIFGSAAFNFKDGSYFEGKIKPYRAWIRYLQR